MWTILKLLEGIQPNYWGRYPPPPPPRVSALLLPTSVKCELLLDCFLRLLEVDKLALLKDSIQNSCDLIRRNLAVHRRDQADEKVRTIYVYKDYTTT